MSVFTALLNRDYTIYPLIRTSDGQGGWAESHSPTGTTVRGRMRTASVEDGERLTAMQEQRRVSHVLYVEHGTDIARGYRVTGDGVTVDVVAVREPSRADHHLEVDCSEVQLETAEVGS